jgi:protein-S-isoprenylcysteine O-methyltransferase Ste14
VCVGVLFVLLSLNLFNDFVRTGRVTGLLFLVSESLVVVLTVARRHARIVDRSALSAVLTTVSLMGPPLLRPGGIGLVPDALTAIFSAIGVCIVILGKLTLGRSFGLVPANRGIVTGGPYNIVRHPIYTGYLVTHVGFLLAYPTAWNITLCVVADAALIIRALLEERVLSADGAYQAYCRRVGWHLVPGLF